MDRYRQRDVTDCGAASLGFVAAHYGKVLSIARLRQIAGTNQRGSTALGLVEAARQLGFTAKGVKGPVEALGAIPLPAIAHCLIDQRLLHYVVLVDWTPRYARVMDPAVGRVEKWPRAKFESVWTGILILLAPDGGFQPGHHTESPAQRLWRLLQPHRAMIAQAFFGAVVTTILGLSMAIYVEKIVDQVIPDGNRQLLNLLGVVMLCILGFKLLLGWLQSLLSIRTAQRIDATLMLGYYRHLLRLPQAFFDTMRVGEITSRVGDAIKIRNFLNVSLLSLLLNPLILLFTLVAMFFWSWKLAVLSLAVLPGNAAIYWLVDRLNGRYQRQLMERGADFGAQLVESLHAQPVLRRFRLEDYAALRTENRLVRLLRIVWRTSLVGAGSNTAATLVNQAYLIGLLWLGAGLVLRAGLSPGQLMSCYTLAGYLTGPVGALIGLNASVQETLIATDRLFELMDLELEPDQGTIEFTAAHAQEIRLEQVSFKHAGRAATLQDMTLSLPPGRITALVGASGCGKSTLLALLQRLYLPVAGRILIGGIDVRYFRLASLRQHLAVVTQQTHLLSGTVLENLAPGENQPDMERLLGICRDLGLLGFIEQLPQGFFTYLNENGMNLSGGQRQRLAMARALYSGAPILLLDEPSSALDAGSEEALALRLRELCDGKGKTIILAAHSSRLTAVADLVVTLAEGRILSVSAASPRTGIASQATGSSAPVDHLLAERLPAAVDSAGSTPAGPAPPQRESTTAPLDPRSRAS
ncbi:MAG TPA: peptidase domain-containing ABC transporter [Lacunisphaera sp.]|nr:peptidase domain-containing ABC transporter [Lacunisphaera sp.]